MIERRLFAGGWTTLTVLFKPAPDDAAMALYYERLSERLTDAGWMAAVETAQVRHRFTTFPTIAELLEYGVGSEDRSSASEANLAFDLVVHRGTVHDIQHVGRPCDCAGNYTWSPGLLERRYGVAVARAFVEAGGSAVFSGMLDRDQPFIRKRFVEAYLDRVKLADGRQPGIALPPHEVAKAFGHSPVPQLPEPKDVITRAEARAIVGKAKIR